MITAWILLSNSRAVYAHEISPSVADLTINGNSVSLTINLNVANDYDLYRAMQPEQLEQAFRVYWPEMSNKLQIKAPEALALELVNITVPPTGNTDLPRKSEINIRANLQVGTGGLIVAWPADYGALIIPCGLCTYHPERA